MGDQKQTCGIIGGVEFNIVKWNGRYDRYENREAMLVYREGKMILRVPKKNPKSKPYRPKDVVAIDVK